MNFKWKLFKSLEDREECWSNMPQNSQGVHAGTKLFQVRLALILNKL